MTFSTFMKSFQRQRLSFWNLNILDRSSSRCFHQGGGLVSQKVTLIDTDWLNENQLRKTQINDNTGCYRVSLSFLSFFHDLCIIYGDSVGDMDLGLRLCMIYYMLDYYL